MSLGKNEILNRFGFHKASIEGPNATAPKHADLRIQFSEFALYLDSVLPDGRYKDIVLEELEDASMWAHKAIAQNAPLIDESKPILVCEDADDNCFGEVSRWFIYPDDINSFVLCNFHRRKRAARPTDTKDVPLGKDLLICEYALLDAACRGTVRIWFVYPDPSTPHELCEAHIEAKNVKAISPAVFVPGMVVDFDPPQKHTLIVQQPGDPTVKQALREEEAKLLPENEEYDADAYNLGNAGLD